MNIIIKDAYTFRQIINSLKDLIVDSGELLLDSRGISMISMDSTKVVLIDMILEQDSFIKYDLVEKEIKLGLNFENFNNILKLSKSSNIGISYKPGTEKLTLKLNEHDKKKIQFDMNLSNVDKNELEMQDIDYSVKIYIETSEFQKSIKDLSSFGKKCNIVVNENDISFTVIGDVGTGEITLSDVEIEYSSDIYEFTGVFNVKYLNLFAKANLSNEIILKFGKGVPLCIEYQLEYGHVRFYLSEMVD